MRRGFHRGTSINVDECQEIHVGVTACALIAWVSTSVLAMQDTAGKIVIFRMGSNVTVWKDDNDGSSASVVWPICWFAFQDWQDWQDGVVVILCYWKINILKGMVQQNLNHGVVMEMHEGIPVLWRLIQRRDVGDRNAAQKEKEDVEK